jgi:hypothetical protein
MASRTLGVNRRSFLKQIFQVHKVEKMFMTLHTKNLMKKSFLPPLEAFIVIQTPIIGTLELLG